MKKVDINIGKEEVKISLFINFLLESRIPHPKDCEEVGQREITDSCEVWC